MSLGTFLQDVHTGLWTLLEGKTSFTSAVTSGNRIKFTSNPYDVWRKEVAESQLPEVAVVQAELRPSDRAESNCTGVEIIWEVWVAMGSQKFTEFLPIQGSILAALLNWDATMKAITWRSENPVKDCNLLSSKDSLAHELAMVSRERMHWCSVWRGSTDCWFSHSKIKLET